MPRLYMMKTRYLSFALFLFVCVSILTLFERSIRSTTSNKYDKPNNALEEYDFENGNIIVLNSQHNLKNRQNNNRAKNSSSSTPIGTKSKVQMSKSILGSLPPELAGLTKPNAKTSSIKENITTSSPGCKFPKFNINDPELAKLFEISKPLNCSPKGDTPWTNVHGGTFYIRPDAVKQHGPITCNYTAISYKTDYDVVTKLVKNFQNGTKLETDFGKFECKAEKSGVQQIDFHVTTVPSNNLNSKIGNTTDGNKRKSNNKLNVYMLGLDSLSRMTFQRKLPKTHEFLTKNLGAIVLEGYNIVGDGTPQALIPILTGQTEPELPLTRRRYKEANYVNVYPFVWNNYRDAGYATLYSEDQTDIGTFTYRLKGFDHQPTHHYMRTFFRYVERYYSKFVSYCLGLVPQFYKFLTYTEEFWTTYPKNVPKFAFHFHVQLSHDSINVGGSVDDTFRDHLENFQRNNWLNNTILIVMSDHGHRFTQIRETQQGQLEERNPFFSFTLPPWFAKAHPNTVANLRTNAAHRLTTPFDIYATLRQILAGEWDGVEMGTEKSASGTKSTVPINRSLSLFKPIPESRTCAEAAIEPHWCSCLSWQPMEPGDAQALRLAHVVTDVINRETAEFRDRCAKLRLARVISAARYVPDESLMRYKSAQDLDGFVADLSGKGRITVVHFQIRLETTPGAYFINATIPQSHK